MKKMIPVYLLQVALLVAVLFVGSQITKELQSVKAEISRTTNTDGTLDRLDAPATRVRIVGR